MEATHRTTPVHLFKLFNKGFVDALFPISYINRFSLSIYIKFLADINQHKLFKRSYLCHFIIITMEWINDCAIHLFTGVESSKPDRMFKKTAPIGTQICTLMRNDFELFPIWIVNIHFAILYIYVDVHIAIPAEWIVHIERTAYHPYNMHSCTIEKWLLLSLMSTSNFIGISVAKCTSYQFSMMAYMNVAKLMQSICPFRVFEHGHWFISAQHMIHSDCVENV